MKSQPSRASDSKKPQAGFTDVARAARQQHVFNTTRPSYHNRASWTGLECKVVVKQALGLNPIGKESQKTPVP